MNIEELRKIIREELKQLFSEDYLEEKGRKHKKHRKNNQYYAHHPYGYWPWFSNYDSDGDGGGDFGGGDGGGGDGGGE